MCTVMGVEGRSRQHMFSRIERSEEKTKVLDQNSTYLSADYYLLKPFNLLLVTIGLTTAYI